MAEVEEDALLVLVCSCREYGARRSACRETWLAEAPAGVRYAFLVGGPPPDGEPDVWGLAAPDTYEGLPEKVRAAFARALTQPGWEWLFKCDDDTYCRLPRLLEMVRGLDATESLLVSWRGNAANTAHGGAGYLLPRALVEAVVADEAYNATGVAHEDKQVTWAVERAGGVFCRDSRFCAEALRAPRPGNNLVTAHHLDPERMRQIHAVWRPKAVQQPIWLRPQSTRRLPAVLHRVEDVDMSAGEQVLRVPPEARRVVVLSNVPGLDARAVVKPGDCCVHVNRARYADVLSGVPGVRHLLVVRRGRDARTDRLMWYEPPSMGGFEQVLRVRDIPMRARRGWWQEYCRENPGMSPTTGFICWRLAQEAANGKPVVLVGFNPAQDCGTYRWPYHAWEYEDRVYKQAGVQALPPRKNDSYETGN